MKDKEILYQSLVDIKKLITSKELSPVELTQMSLERIDETNDKTNAFLNVYPEMALADAKNVHCAENVLCSWPPMSIGQ